MIKKDNNGAGDLRPVTQEGERLWQYETKRWHAKPLQSSNRPTTTGRACSPAGSRAEKKSSASPDILFTESSKKREKKKENEKEDG